MFQQDFLFEQQSHVCLVVCIFDYHENNSQMAYASAIGDRDCFQTDMTDGRTIRSKKRPMAGVWGDDYHKGLSEGSCR